MLVNFSVLSKIYVGDYQNKVNLTGLRGFWAPACVPKAL